MKKCLVNDLLEKLLFLKSKLLIHKSTGQGSPCTSSHSPVDPVVKLRNIDIGLIYGVKRLDI